MNGFAKRVVLDRFYLLPGALLFSGDRLGSIMNLALGEDLKVVSIFLIVNLDKLRQFSGIDINSKARQSHLAMPSLAGIELYDVWSGYDCDLWVPRSTGSCGRSRTNTVLMRYDFTRSSFGSFPSNSSVWRGFPGSLKRKRRRSQRHISFGAWQTAKMSLAPTKEYYRNSSANWFDNCGEDGSDTTECT